MKKRILGFLTVFLAVVALLTGCEKKYTVDFEENDGSEVAAVTVVGGQLLEEPAAPTKEDMTFLGWYADIDLTEKYDFSQPVTESLILYAQWGVTLTFDSMGGSAVDPIVGKALSPISLPAAPTRDGYVFDGWYQDKEYTKPQTILSPAKNATAYARWSVKDDATALDLNHWTIQDAGSYKYSVAENGDQTFQAVNPHLVINKSYGEWAGVWSNATGAAIKNMTKLTVEVKGTAGQQLLVKLNDQGGACEKWVDMDGTVQTVEFAFPEGVTINEAATALVFMANGGKNDASGDYVFTKILFDNGETGDKLATVDILKSGWSSGVEYTVEAYIGTDTYSFVKTYINHDVTEYNAVIMEVVGTKGCQILLKLEQGGIEAPIEQAFTMTGEVQTITWVVADKFLTKTGGEMFLWFLNPGNAGATAGAEEYVTIKSAGLYKLVAEGNENKESSIFFNENGGSAVETITQTIGSDVAAPTEPTKEGFNFLGWYTDEALTQAYTFGKMPEASIELFAAWEKATVDPKSVNMLADTFVPNACCTVTQENGVLVIKKNEGSPYESAASTLKVEDILSGMSFLKIEFQGSKGQEVIFKVGDYWECEKKVVCTGEVQYIEYEFDFSKLPAGNKALIIMPGVHADGASDNLTITHLEFANYRSKEDMLADTFVPNACCTVTQENGVLVIKKNEGSPYESVASTLTAEALKPFSVLKVEFQGSKGQEVIFKVGDYWECEKKVVCTGEVQYIEYVFDFTKLPTANKALIIMPGVHADGASDNLTITRLEFANEFDHVDLKEGWIENDNSSYVINNENGVLTVKKNNTWVNGSETPGTEWCFAKNTITGIEEGKYTTMVIKFTGSVAGQEIIFALGTVESKPFTTGAEQVVEIKFNGTIANNTELKIFANAGQLGSCELVITEMYLK